VFAGVMVGDVPVGWEMVESAGRGRGRLGTIASFVL